MINHAQFYQLRVVVSHPRKKYGSLANPQEHTIPNLPFINHKSSPFIVGNWKYMGFIIQSQSLTINHHIDIISHPKGMKIEISLHVLVGFTFLYLLGGYYNYHLAVQRGYRKSSLLGTTTIFKNGKSSLLPVEPCKV